MKTPFLGGAYVSRSTNLADQRCVNLVPEVVETKDAKAVGAFYGAAGLDLLATVGPGPHRGALVMGDFLYVVSGPYLYQVNNAWVAFQIGTLQTGGDPVGMVTNGTQLLVVDSVKGYVWDQSTNYFDTITDINFPDGPKICAYQDGFAVVNRLGTDQWFASDINDFLSWNGLSFSSADAQPGPIVSIFDNHREVWLFKDTTTEIWINAGLPGFVFQRLSGVFIQYGCAAAYSVDRVGGSIMWLGRNDEGQGVVYVAQGYTPKRISTHAIEHAIQGYSRIDDAIAFSYEQEGHFYYFLTFPTGDATWVYDLATGLWHERAYFANGSFSRHRGTTHAHFAGKCITGDYANGNLYCFNLNTYTDAGQTRKWLRSWRAMPPNQSTSKTMRFDSLSIDCQTGVDIPPDANPQLALRWSDDGGNNWSNERLQAFGKTGHTAQRIIFKRLGSTRRNSGLDRIFELSCSDAVPAALMGANLN